MKKFPTCNFDVGKLAIYYQHHITLYVIPLLAVEVSLMSPGYFVTNMRERIASIMVNGKEMSQNRYGLNIVVFNYLSGKYCAMLYSYMII